MNTCGTCKWRGTPIENAEGYFLCDRIMQKNSAGYIYEGELPKGEKAAVIDGSGYYAALCVESDFGCNLWEPK